MKLENTLSLFTGILFTCLPIEFPQLPFMVRLIELMPRLYAYYNWVILYFIGVIVFHILHYTYKVKKSFEFKTGKIDFILAIVFGCVFTLMGTQFPIIPFLQDLLTLFPEIYEYYNYLILYTIGSSTYYIFRFIYKVYNPKDKHTREIMKELKEEFK